jgi:hypothetical protein
MMAITTSSSISVNARRDALAIPGTPWYYEGITKVLRKYNLFGSTASREKLKKTRRARAKVATAFEWARRYER